VATCAGRGKAARPRRDGDADRQDGEGGKRGRVGGRKGDCWAARLTHGSDGGERRWRASPKEDGGDRRRQSCGTGVGEHSNEP